MINCTIQNSALLLTFDYDVISMLEVLEGKSEGWFFPVADTLTPVASVSNTFTFSLKLVISFFGVEEIMSVDATRECRTREYGGFTVLFKNYYCVV